MSTEDDRKENRSHQKSFRPKKKISNVRTDFIDEIPTLRFGENNNFLDVERELLVQGRIKFGILGTLLEQ